MRPISNGRRPEAARWHEDSSSYRTAGAGWSSAPAYAERPAAGRGGAGTGALAEVGRAGARVEVRRRSPGRARREPAPAEIYRSEEHTSELQPHSFISYAV